jgi:hypothetical protein
MVRAPRPHWQAWHQIPRPCAPPPPQALPGAPARRRHGRGGGGHEDAVLRADRDQAAAQAGHERAGHARGRAAAYAGLQVGALPGGGGGKWVLWVWLRACVGVSPKHPAAEPAAEPGTRRRPPAARGCSGASGRRRRRRCWLGHALHAPAQRTPPRPRPKPCCSPIPTQPCRAEVVFTQASDCQRAGQEPNQRACKYALNTLMACCSIPAITLRLAQATLHDLVGILLMVLIDGGIQAMPQGGWPRGACLRRAWRRAGGLALQVQPARHCSSRRSCWYWRSPNSCLRNACGRGARHMALPRRPCQISPVRLALLDQMPPPCVPPLLAGNAMLTAINVLMLRILENSNKNCAFGSLLQHLLVCPGKVRAACRRPHPLRSCRRPEAARPPRGGGGGSSPLRLRPRPRPDTRLAPRRCGRVARAWTCAGSTWWSSAS